MAVQVEQTVIPMPPPLMYKGVYAPVETFGDLQDEFETLAKVMAVNNHNAYRTLRSMQNVLNAGVDNEGNIIRQVAHPQMQKEGLLRTVNFERGVKAFVTDLMFRTITFGGVPGAVLQWSGGGVWPPNNANIYWADYNPVNIINIPVGQSPLSAFVTRYFYIDPRNDNYTVAPTANAWDAIRDGRILLCSGKIPTRGLAAINMPWRHIVYGGGIPTES